MCLRKNCKSDAIKGLTMANADLLLQPLEHPRLSTETEWCCLGDVALLEAQRFEPVILSRSLAPDQIAAAYQKIEAAVKAGAVVVGGFISSPEKNVARRLANLPELKLIRVLPFSLQHYPLTPGAKRRILEGKTLILSGFSTGDTALTRTNCIKMNRWILQLCAAGSADEAPLTSSLRPSSPSVCQMPPERDPAAIFL